MARAFCDPGGRWRNERWKLWLAVGIIMGKLRRLRGPSVRRWWQTPCQDKISIRWFGRSGKWSDGTVWFLNISSVVFFWRQFGISNFYEYPDTLLMEILYSWFGYLWKLKVLLSDGIRFRTARTSPRLSPIPLNIMGLDPCILNMMSAR